mmetsp:Transcript_36652/g.85928  ORF Transcript_36652/g.85928 Transcript_36652/m.85928 type:complete len:915 (+) Transcript_36652:28-2772(+)
MRSEGHARQRGNGIGNVGMRYGHVASDESSTKPPPVAYANVVDRFERILAMHMVELRHQLVEMEERILGATATHSERGLFRKPSKTSVLTAPSAELVLSSTEESGNLPFKSAGQLQVPPTGGTASAFRRIKAPPGASAPQTPAPTPPVGSQQDLVKAPSLGTLGTLVTGSSADKVGVTSSHSGGSAPNNFSLNSHWQGGVDSIEMAVQFAVADHVISSSYESAKYNSTGSGMAKEGPVCMMRPSSSLRLNWDILGVLFILYDVITIPIFLAFNPQDNGFTVAMFWLVLSFWTCDIILSFNTGIYKGGVEEMRRWPVAVSYLRSWFILDLMVVGVDWSVFVISNVQRQQGISMARVSKTVRTIRIIRSLRLLRIFKVKRLMEYIQDHITSEFLQIILKMANLMFVVLLINHNIACIWYFIGDGIDGLVHNGWVQVGGFYERSQIYSYFTALHWSLTQFTTGSMEISAGTIPERVYSVVVLVFALMVFSSFLSSITASMTQLRNLTNAFDQKFSLLRRYLKHQTVPARLSIRILRCVQHKLSNEKREVRESDVTLLTVLSKNLQRELMQFINQPKLMRHPLFCTLAKVDKQAVQDLCHTALAVINLTAGDYLFNQRGVDGQMYFCAKGVLIYQSSRKTVVEEPDRNSQTHSSDRVSHQGSWAKSFSNITKAFRQARAEQPTHLYPQDWCCEPAVWTTWMHVGSMHASTASEVLALAGSDFAENASTHSHLLGPCVQYAQSYIAHLNVLSSKNALSDMPIAEIFKCEDFAAQAFDQMMPSSPVGMTRVGSDTKTISRLASDTKTMSNASAISARSGPAARVQQLLSPQADGTGSASFWIHGVQSNGSNRHGAETGFIASPTGGHPGSFTSTDGAIFLPDITAEFHDVATPPKSQPGSPVHREPSRQISDSCFPSWDV